MDAQRTVEGTEGTGKGERRRDGEGGTGKGKDQERGKQDSTLPAQGGSNYF